MWRAIRILRHLKTIPDEGNECLNIEDSVFFNEAVPFRSHDTAGECQTNPLIPKPLALQEPPAATNHSLPFQTVPSFQEQLASRCQAITYASAELQSDEEAKWGWRVGCSSLDSL